MTIHKKHLKQGVLNRQGVLVKDKEANVEPIRMTQTLGWVIFLGAPLLILFGFWADYTRHANLAERLEWAKAYSNMEQIGFRAELVENPRSLVYQLFRHIISEHQTTSVVDVSSDGKSTIEIVGHNAIDRNTILSFPSGIRFHARKSMEGEALLREKLSTFEKSLSDESLEASDLAKTCNSISKGIEKVFSSALANALQNQICTVAAFLKESVNDKEKVAWVLRCRTITDGGDSPWAVDARYKRGGGISYFGSMTGVEPCHVDEIPDTKRSTASGWISLSPDEWGVLKSSYDNPYKDRNFVSFTSPEPIRWNQDMEMGVLERELRLAKTTSDRKRVLGEAKERLLARLNAAQKELEVSISGLALPTIPILILCGALWSYLLLLYLSVRARIRSEDTAIERQIALTAPQFGSFDDPLRPLTPQPFMWVLKFAPRSIWLVALLLPIVVNALVFIRFQPIDFFSRISYFKDTVGASSELLAPMYSLYSRDSSLISFFVETTSLIGLNLYVMAMAQFLGRNFSPTPSVKQKESDGLNVVFEFAGSAGLVGLIAYLLARAASLTTENVLIATLCGSVGYWILYALSARSENQLRFFMSGIAITWIATVLLAIVLDHWHFSTQFLCNFSVLNLLFSQIALTRYCISIGGRTSIAICLFGTGLLLFSLGIEFRSLII